MKKKGHTPITRVKNPEPNVESPDWVIWAAWADRITFEEIEKKTGYKESDVIKIMRRSLKPSSFRLWRKRVNQKFTELVQERAGKSLDDYELRKIGSEVEGLIKYLLQNGLLSYNPECRVMNYSMGLPKTKEVL